MLKFKVKIYENDKESYETGVVDGLNFSDAMRNLEDYYGETILEAELKWTDIEGDVITEVEAEEIFAELIERKVQERMLKEMIKVGHNTALQPAEKARSVCNCVETPIASFTYGSIN